MATADAFTIEVERRNDTILIRLAGEIDLSTAGRLTAAVAATNECDEIRGVVVDLESVGFIDSSGLHALLRCRNAVTTIDREFHAANPSPAVRHLFELTGTDVLFQPEHDPDGV